MSLSLKIALRYLISKKSHNAINIISALSMGGIALATMAMVCTMSVFNGFRNVVESLYTTFDPELKVTPTIGKYISENDSILNLLRNHESVVSATNVLEEHALILFEGHPLIVTLKGVEDNYTHTTHINSILRGTGDTLLLRNGEQFFGVPGLALARYIAGSINYGTLQMCAPKKGERINIANPTESFNVDYLTSANQAFVVNQEKYDEHYFLTHINFTQRLFDQEGKLSSLELRLQPNASATTVQHELQQIAGHHFNIQNRLEQQANVYNVMNIEKLMAYLFLSFILLITTFNIVGSLSMLIIEKRLDMNTLHNLGATPNIIHKIFLLEGCLIALIGAFIGCILGLCLCIGQQEFGWLKFGNGDGMFLLDVYPVSIAFSDLIIILLTVFIVSSISIWWPVRYLTRRLL
ncbi:MAG: ABC transporter permease [Bacteroidaceae bacterium]|nr:ABC transporter permease [Bacteroidaceae bacterium]